MHCSKYYSVLLPCTYRVFLAIAHAQLIRIVPNNYRIKYDVMGIFPHLIVDYIHIYRAATRL